MLGDFEVSFCSVISVFHVYQAIWTPTVGKELITEREHGNPADAYAVAVRKSGTTVGHIHREISKTSWHFIGHNGEISCKVNGSRQRSILLEGRFLLHEVS